MADWLVQLRICTREKFWKKQKNKQTKERETKKKVPGATALTVKKYIYIIII